MRNFLLKKKISGAIILISALMAANFLNFVFNAFLGRVITLEEYGVLTLINTLWFLMSIFLNGLTTTTNHYVALHYGKLKKSESFLFYNIISKNGFKTSLLMTTIWLALAPFIASIFNLSNWYTVLSITPIISLGTMVAISRGYLQGSFMFATVAVLVIAESVSKLIFAGLFVMFHLDSVVYLSIPLSVLTAFIITYILAPNSESKKDKLELKKITARFPLLYFFGSLLNSFVITLVSRDIGQGQDFKTTFYKIFGLSVLLTFIAYIALGQYGNIFVPILLGDKAYIILPYLSMYGFGIAVFTISSTVISFHLSHKRYIFAYGGLSSIFLLIAGIFLFHRTILQITYVIFFISSIHFLTVMLLHMYYLHWRKVIKEIKLLQPILPVYKNALPLPVSICLPAYNEGDTIGKLLDKLLKQRTEAIKINKIIVVSSASTDNTDEVVRRFQKQDERIVLIREKTRNGKATAINCFLKHTSDPIVVLQSTDTIPYEDTIERLCYPFLTDKKIGMTGGAPIPINDPETFLGFIVHTWWWFHRNIPRFGEIIAYRNILPEISAKTAVDEAYIQAKFVQMGYKVVLVDDAVIFNKGADTIRDMVKQRRRIHNGHSRLIDEESVPVKTFSKNMLWLFLFKYEIINFRQLLWLIGGIFIEIWAVILATWDKHIEGKNPVVWDIAESTKVKVTVSKVKKR